jgi:predicted HTH domain antitoxin
VKAFSIRQLKNNPSEALREARRQPVVVMNRDRPEALLVHLDDDALLSEPGVRRALATALFREESLSLGAAARLAAMPVAEFMVHVSRLGIPVVRGTPEAVRDDARSIDSWRTGSSPRTPAR